MRQIEKLYKKEKYKQDKDEEKKYVVNKSFNHHTGKTKTPRGVKMVDGRMKKDLKIEKARSKRVQKNGRSKTGKGLNRGLKGNSGGTRGMGRGGRGGKR